MATSSRRKLSSPKKSVVVMSREQALQNLSETGKALVTRYIDARIAQTGKGVRTAPKFIDAIQNGTTKSYSTPDQTGNPYLMIARLFEATGSVHEQAHGAFIADIQNVYRKGGEGSHLDVEAAFAHMLDIAPQDGIEGMLAVQMVCTHRAAIRKLAASIGQSVEVSESYVNQATRLMRLFTLQLAALKEHRGKPRAEQKVTVEHVHVHEGGQAVVGNVTTPPKQPDEHGIEPEPESINATDLGG